VWHDAFICVTWRIHMCDVTHSHVWHDSFTCVICCTVRVCPPNRNGLCHVNETHRNELCHVNETNEFIPMSEWVMSPMNESCHVCEWVMSPMTELCHMNETNEFIPIKLIPIRLYHMNTAHMNSLIFRHHSLCHVNKSCHIWMSHVTYVNESYHVWMRRIWTHSYSDITCYVTSISHVTYEWVMSHMNESCHIWMSHVTYESVMSHIHESCHIWMSHVTYEWVMSHMNESCHIWMSHVSTHSYSVMSRDRRGKFTTNLVPYWWIQQVQNTTSCHNLDTINLNLN